MSLFNLRNVLPLGVALMFGLSVVLSVGTVMAPAAPVTFSATEVVEEVAAAEPVDEVVEEALPLEEAPVEEPAAEEAPEASVDDPVGVGEVLGQSVEETPVEEAAPEAVAEESSVGGSSAEEASAPAAITAAELTTEEADYHPGETATIIGRLFGSLQEIVLKIFGSDDNNENYVESTQTVTTDEEGNFTATYTLDDLYRPFYEMTASALDGTLLASGWFRDAAVDIYDQCSNDDGDGYNGNPGECGWTNGNLQSNNSTYTEGDATVQRLSIKGFSPGEHTITLRYGTTKQGKHAYDYLTSWDWSEDWVAEGDRCDGIANCIGTPEDRHAFPDDLNVPNTIETFVAGTRDLVARGADITDISAPVVTSGTYAGDSETEVTVTFMVPDDGPMCTTAKVQGKDVTSCTIAMWFGAHIAEGELWTTHDGTTGAGSISGSPYHVQLAALDGGSVGNRDNQMQANAIVVPEDATLTLLKTVVNNNGGTALDTAWTLAANGPTPISGTEGSAAITAAVVTPGQYSLSESGGPAGYTASQYSCVVNGGAPVVGNSVTLAAGDDAICTITNDDQPGHLIVHKVTVPASDTATQFSITASGGTIVSPAATESIVGGGSVDYTVNAGTYSVSEADLAGWDETSNTCADVVVANGETEHCTITNTKRGTIVIVKDVIGNPDPTDFTFQNNFGNGHPASFMLDEDNNGDLPSSRSFEVLPGTYAVSEDALAGWQQESATCDSGETVDSIDVAPGETVTCTFVNEELISITLVKNTIGGDASFDFDATGTGLPADIDLVTVAGTATQTFTGLDQDDTFSIAENVPAGWVLTSATCTGGETPESITPEPGEDVTCTFTNTKNGSITIVKDVVGADKDFGFTGAIVTSLGDGDESTLEVAPGQYVVTESADAAYALTSLTCTDANSTGNTGTRTATFNVEAGENVTCTFVNSELPTLTLEKTVTNDNGGTATQDDFQGKIDGVDQEWDVAKTLTPGSYTASEATLSTYTASDWGGHCAADGSVTLAYGDHKTCSITNDDKAPSLTLNKITNYNYGGTAPESSWTLTADGGSAGTLSGAGAAGSADVVSGAAFKAGTYTLSESAAPAGYTNGASYSCVKNGGQAVAGNSITLALGDTAVCSITNTDQPGALSVTKAIAGIAGVVNGNTVDDTFTVTVTGPSYPGGHQIVFTLTDGVLQNPNPVVLNNLIIGNYTVTEADAGTEWTESVPANAVPVVAGQTAEATVTNTYVPGSLELSKVVDLNDYLFPQGVDTSFTFEVTGPSYPVAEEVVINVVDGVPAGAQTLQNLIPGDYTVTEVGEDTVAWTVSGEGGVGVTAGGTAQKAVTNSLKIPSTEISITPSVYETEPGQNVVLTITDTNNGETPITDPSVELYANNVLTNPQPSYVSGDANTNDILDIGETWTWNVALLINANTTFVVNGLGTDPLGNPVNGPTYAGETDSVVVRTIGATRTIGFWQTHTNFTTDMFEDYLVPAGKNFVGVNAPVVPGSHKGILTSIGQVFGGFYAPIAKTTTGMKRAPIDQARVTMLQQLLAAKLNCAAFGCSAATQTLIASADAAYAAGANKNSIMSLSAQLDAFNNSGDANAIPATLPATGKATPKTSQSVANTAFWNQP